jgi:hypothetical protein
MVSGLSARHQRRSLQQAGEELAGHIAPHTDPLGTEQRRLERQRRIAFLPKPLEPGAKLLEAVDKIADWALVHPRHAGQPHLAAGSPQPDRLATMAGTSVRMLSPELPTKMIGPSCGKRPPQPETRSAAPSSVTLTPRRRWRCASPGYRRSRADASTRVSPSARAASSSTRLEMLLEPGRRTCRRPCASAADR